MDSEHLGVSPAVSLGSNVRCRDSEAAVLGAARVWCHDARRKAVRKSRGPEGLVVHGCFPTQRKMLEHAGSCVFFVLSIKCSIIEAY